ncbi:class I SAM-dependent methyltransferase [Mycobacterium hodleri]|uniref:Class I SAM-dependent methyltransferase n=1 Tax=Mycolicibacterium hodleri TaxID=49897 RepID=A0A544W545_9MYCO|nr:class I SAM-dependent methyltransferase [Mycolicibacterium hodleri]TQR87360.1 class I SAM-dependent methyltransferase [Mycolicibacterium hodleri]
MESGDPIDRQEVSVADSLGCGTGQLTVPLARHVTEALGVDPEPEMLVEAANRARGSNVTNVAWARGSSEDLPGEFGRFKVVTMGRSFHWMDRERVLTAWQRAVEDLQPRFLPHEALPSPGPASSGESHESLLARSPFPNVHRVIHEFTREWTVDRIVGYLYSTSLPLRRLLGDRRAAFEQEVAATLLAIEPSGRFIEPVALEVHTATRG